MHGSYSIKYVLPALYPDDFDLDCSNLPQVHNGEEASDAFKALKCNPTKYKDKIRIISLL